MPSYQQLFTLGEEFESFVSRGLPAEVDAVRDIQQLLSDGDTISAGTRQRVQAIKGRFHLLVVAEMWCPDCQINVTVLDELQRMQPNITVAVISKAHAENQLQQRLGLERVSIPLVLVLDERFELVGRFVEQPQAVITGGDALKSAYRAGKFLQSTLEDLLDIFEASSRTPAA